MHLRLVEHLLLGIYFTMLFSITVFSIELCTKYRKAYPESDKVCANVLRGFLSAGGLRFDVESRRSETEHKCYILLLLRNFLSFSPQTPTRTHTAPSVVCSIS